MRKRKEIKICSQYKNAKKPRMLILHTNQNLQTLQGMQEMERVQRMLRKKEI